MPTKARAKMIRETAEKKTHYKLYKNGRNWTVAGLTVLFSGLLLMQQPQAVQADDATPPTPVTDTTDKSAAPANTATLTPTTQTSVATIGTQTITSGESPALPTVTMAKDEVAPDWTQADFDFSKVDTATAGSYSVTLSAAGLAKLQAANPQQTIVASQVKAGSVTVTAKNSAVQNTKAAAKPIAAARAAKTLAVQATVGNVTKVYDGKTDTPTLVTVTLSAGTKAPATWYATGTVGTYQVNVAKGDVQLAADGQPGTSAITLSAQGLAALQAANSDANVTAADVTAGTLTITKALVQAGSVTVGNQTKKYDNNPATDPTSYNVTLPAGMSAPSTWTQNADGSYALTTTAGDIAVADDSSQAAGDYAVNLTPQALAALQAANPTLDVQAASVAAGKLTIASTGTVSVGSTTIGTNVTTLPATIQVSVTGNLKVPDDWHWNYQSTESNDYPIALTAANFDLSRVQLGTASSYEIALSDSLKAQLQALNPDVVLDGRFSSGKIDVTTTTNNSNNVYSPSWLWGIFDGVWNWGVPQVNKTLVAGQGYDYQLGLYARNGGAISDGFTEYVILPDGFALADASGSNTVAIDPAAKLHDIIDAVFTSLAAAGYTGTTVTQLADYQGRQTLQITIHTDGTNQSFNGLPMYVDVPIVVADRLAGTQVQLASSDDALDPDVVYITDDPNVTGGTYRLNLGGYSNVPTVAAALGIQNAYGLSPRALGNPYYINVVANVVQQKFDLVTPSGKNIGSVSYSGANGSAYNPLTILPRTIADDGVTYVLDTTQLPASDTLKGAPGETPDATTNMINAVTQTIVYRQLLNEPITVGDASKAYDDDVAVPMTYTVILPAGFNAPADWQASSTANTYLVAADSPDLDLSAVSQTAGSYALSLSAAGQSALAAVNPNYLFGSEMTVPGKLVINATVQVNYEYPSVVATYGWSSENHLSIAAAGQTYTIGYGASATDKIVVPTIAGYDATIVDVAGKQTKLTSGQSLTFTSDGSNQSYRVVYTLREGVHLITVSYNNPQATVYLPSSAYLLDEGTQTNYTFSSGEQTADNIEVVALPGYYATVTDDTGKVWPVTTDLTFTRDGQNHHYTVNYVHGTVITTYYKDENFNDVHAPLAVAYKAGQMYTHNPLAIAGYVLDPQYIGQGQADSGNVLGDAGYFDKWYIYEARGSYIVTTPSNKAPLTIPYPDDPDHPGQVKAPSTTGIIPYVAGYTPQYAGQNLVPADPSDLTQGYLAPAVPADPSQDTPISYSKNSSHMTLGTVTKTIHYVDADGHALTGIADAVSHVNFSALHDTTTGLTIYGPESAQLAGVANPTIKGYTVDTARSDAATTQTQTVHYGDADLSYTVVYTKDAPKVETDTVTKTVHYVDAAGKQLADDYVVTAEFTKSTDPITDAVTYTPITGTLGHQALPSVRGYHVVNSPAEATSDQTVQYGAADASYTVVYARDAPQLESATVTKTVHYVDQDGKQLAADYVATVEFTKSTDPVTGAVTYTPTTNILGHQELPTIRGYHVTSSPAEATSDQSVQYGAADASYTVVYTKDAAVVTSKTVRKTAHFVDESGKKLATAASVAVSFTKTVDPVTAVSSYAPASGSLAALTVPTIKGYHVLTVPSAVITAQTVTFAAASRDYQVVYAKDQPIVTTRKISKTVHYVDGAGKQLAPDFYVAVTLTISTDPVTGTVTVTPAAATLGAQANPQISGYHVTVSPAGASTTQLVDADSQNVELTVVYAKDQPASRPDNGNQSAGHGGTTTNQPHGQLPATGGQATQTTAAGSQTQRQLPATGGQRATPTLTSTKSAAKSLPQTGDDSGSLLAMLGAGLMAMLGLAVKRRKDE